MKEGVNEEEPFDGSGTLLRDAGGFLLARDGGEALPLLLPRVPVDLVGKRVRVIGTQADTGAITAEGVQAD